jgi:hypothetical protein
MASGSAPGFARFHFWVESSLRPFASGFRVLCGYDFVLLTSVVTPVGDSLSIGPVATASGSDLVTNRVIQIETLSILQ